MAGFLRKVKKREAVIAVTTVGIVCAVAGWYSYGPSLLQWRPGFASSPSEPRQAATDQASSPQAASTDAGKADLALTPRTAKSSMPRSTGGESSAGAESKPPAPEFDIVRVERSGQGVIAGRGAPGATIVLKDGDKELARAVADANGEVVLLPPPLMPGEHALTLQSTVSGASSAVSSASVNVVVPNADQHAVTVARAAPPEMSAASPSSAAAPKSQPAASPAPSAPAKPAPAVSIRTAEAEEGGSFYATGSAPPGSQSRLYLNGAFVGKVIADLNGLWSLKVEKGMQPGHYAVRADEVEPESGKVIARAEVPFDFPVASPSSPVNPPANSVASAGPVTESPSPVTSRAIPTKAPLATQAPKSSVEASTSDQPNAQVPPSSSGASASAQGSAAAVVVKEVRTTTVVRGDSLWRISKKMLGRGTRYTQIYEANASQIRNPSLVFPGQVFVLPSDPG